MLRQSSETCFLNVSRLQCGLQLNVTLKGIMILDKIRNLFACLSMFKYQVNKTSPVVSLMQLTGSEAAEASRSRTLPSLLPSSSSPPSPGRKRGGKIRLRVGLSGRQNTKIIHDITRARIGCVRSICSDLLFFQQGLEGGGPDPAFPLLFHENPASRTFSSLSRIPFFLTQKYI